MRLSKSNLENAVKALSRALDEPLRITSYSPDGKRRYCVQVEETGEELTFWVPLGECYSSVIAMTRIVNHLKDKERSKGAD